MVAFLEVCEFGLVCFFVASGLWFADSQSQRVASRGVVDVVFQCACKETVNFNIVASFGHVDVSFHIVS